jgi:hypothetical protein
MKLTCSIVITTIASLVALGAAPASQPGAEAQEKPAGLVGALAPYVGGEWKITATWNGGNPLQARDTFEWGPGKKFVVCKTFVSTPQGEYQRYQTIFGEQDGKLMSWAFTVDGYVDVATFAVEGKKLSATKPVHTADGSDGGIVHQSIELTGPNQFHWLVAIEKDGKTTQIMDGAWKRESSTRDAVGAAK